MDQPAPHAAQTAADPADMAFPPYDTSYQDLPAVLFSHVAPYGASQPRVLALNDGLAEVLGFDPATLNDELAAEIFSGNRLAPESRPLAMAYAGHQFGGFNPGLGDGRALLLGEVVGQDGKRYDIQLKGSGQTPYSRQGDGRAALGPVLREYVVSEAMAALGIPTTRALAAVVTGDPVLRETVQPGAIIARVASSHLRVGTFEFAALQQDRSVLKALTDFAIARHYSDLDVDGPPALRLLKGVVAAQAKLVAQWMGVGFIHGVMNTDNCTISGQTIDYGPCAFMDGYNPAQVYSSIDHQGRYAFANQPPIAHWNMAILAQALLPLIADTEKEAIALAQEAVNAFPSLFQTSYGSLMRAKIGISTHQDGDDQLVKDLLGLMADEEVDFTNLFRALGEHLQTGASEASTLLGGAGQNWLERWLKRLDEAGGRDHASALMAQSNPVIIPRNHQVEAMIAAAYDGDFEPFHAIRAALAAPYNVTRVNDWSKRLTQPPVPEEVVHATFCGT